MSQEVIKDDGANRDNSSDDEDEKAFLMKIYVEYQTDSKCIRVIPKKKRWVHVWPALKKSQAEIKGGQIRCHVVVKARGGSRKKDATIQWKFLKLLTNASKKSQQFS